MGIAAPVRSPAGSVLVFQQMKRILIAEDESAIRRLMTSLLERQGFSVVTAVNGAQAIEMIRAERFDAAILDLMMPIVNGFKVLEVLRNEHPDTPCVIVTAAGEVGLGMLPAGVHVLRKPFMPDALVQQVVELVSAASPAE